MLTTCPKVQADHLATLAIREHLTFEGMLLLFARIVLTTSGRSNPCIKRFLPGRRKHPESIRAVSTRLTIRQPVDSEISQSWAMWK
jgi:hypothetical protein